MMFMRASCLVFMFNMRRVEKWEAVLNNPLPFDVKTSLDERKGERNFKLCAFNVSSAAEKHFLIFLLFAGGKKYFPQSMIEIKFPFGFCFKCFPEIELRLE